MEPETDPPPPDGEQALEQLHQQYRGQLERIAWSILRDWQLAADATQEAFLLLASKFDEVPIEHLHGWLIRTVQLQSHNLRRKQQRAPGTKTIGDQLLSRASPTTDHLDDLVRQEEVDRLRIAIESLPDEQRQIVRARLANQQTFAEISEDIGIPLGTVLSRMRLALKKLREQMPEQQ